MIIDVSGILKNDYVAIDIEFSDKIQGFDGKINSYTISPMVGFNGTLKKSNVGALTLTGTIKYEYDVKCYRCLTNIHGSVELDVEENILDARDTREENGTFVYEGNYLELDIILRSYIILSLPMKQICTKDCKGLCPGCGNNLNIKECQCTKEKGINPQMEILKNYFA